MPREKKSSGYGAAGGRRNTAARSAKQVTRRQRREAQPRVAMSLEEAREHQAEIEAMMQRRSDGPAVGAQYTELTKRALAPQQYDEFEQEDGTIQQVPVIPEYPVQDLILTEDGRVAFRPKPPPPDFIFNAATKKKLSARGGSDNASVCGTARHMLRKGYRIDYVMDKTGARFEYLSDLPIARDGRIPEDKRDDY
jgi:hypothetical protein